MRKILHIDMDAFYASVEQRDTPELKGKPVIVGGKPAARGVVAACSYEAREFGIHSAMPSAQAAKLCPQAIFLPPRFTVYKQVSNQINMIFSEFTKLIEPLSLDEAYLDVTALANHANSATEIAREIKQLIKQRVGLTASAGVSYNKFLAKIASDMDKPDGLYVIRPEHAEKFIESLPIRKFHGVGKVTEQKMQRLGIYTGSDLKKLSKLQLQTQFGRAGGYYYNIARGIDERPVSANRKRKSIGSETTFSEDTLDKAKIWATLQTLSDNVAQALNKKELHARTLTLKVRYANFQIVTRSKTTITPIVKHSEILELLPQLLHKTEVGRKPIRLIGVTLANLATPTSDDPEATDTASTESQQLRLFNQR